MVSSRSSMWKHPATPHTGVGTGSFQHTMKIPIGACREGLGNQGVGRLIRCRCGCNGCCCCCHRKLHACFLRCGLDHVESKLQSLPKNKCAELALSSLIPVARAQRKPINRSQLHHTKTCVSTERGPELNNELWTNKTAVRSRNPKSETAVFAHKSESYASGGKTSPGPLAVTIPNASVIHCAAASNRGSCPSSKPSFVARCPPPMRPVMGTAP